MSSEMGQFDDDLFVPTTEHILAYDEPLATVRYDGSQEDPVDTTMQAVYMNWGDFLIKINNDPSWRSYIGFNPLHKIINR